MVCVRYLFCQVVSMEVYVARQPILNQKLEAVAFELLYRNSNTELAVSLQDPDGATVDVLVHAMFNIGWERISDGKPCFVNFTQNLLLSRLPHRFSPTNIVVELLEDIEPTPSVLDACYELKQKGYQIALDDVAYRDKDHPLLEWADYVKIDFMQTNKYERRMLAEKVRKLKRAKLVAEKVETWDEYEEAKTLGFEYFQGYFFCKPVTITGKDIPCNPLTSWADLYVELHRDEPDVEKLAAIIESDVSLAYTMLKIIRRPQFMTRYKIRSIKHALLLLGIEEVKKIVYLLSLKKFSVHPSQEALRVSLVRAKLCERLACLKPEVYRPDECFLIGLLSMLDVLLGMPMEEVVRDLPLAEHVADTLQGKTNWPEYGLLQCAVLLEKGKWTEALGVTAELAWSADDLLRLYVDAVAWADAIFPYVHS